MHTFHSGPLTLDSYTSNMTYLAKQGVFSPIAGYETSITQIFQILLRQTHHKYNPLLLDSDEQRRASIIIEVIRLMASGNAPDPLSSWKVLALDYKTLFANIPISFELSSSRNQQTSNTFQEKNLDQPKPINKESQNFPQMAEQGKTAQVISSRLQAIFQAMCQIEENVVLFVDHFHRLLGGEWQSYPIDIANLLVPMLARREIRIIGACTLSQYQEHIASLGALARRFWEIPLS